MWAPNTFPAWFHIGCLVFLVTVLLIRVLLVRQNTTFERQITLIVVFLTLSSLFREPAVAAAASHVTHIGLPLIFDLWHWLYVVGTVHACGLFLLWDRGRTRYIRPFRALLIGAVVVGVALLVLSYPGWATGVSVLNFPGGQRWRYGAYFGVYTGYIILVTVIDAVPLFGLWRRATRRRERGVVAIFVLVLVGGFLNMTELGVGAFLDVRGVTGPLVDGALKRASGELLTPSVVLIVLVLVPSSIHAVAEFARLDVHSREALRLRPVWRDLTTAVDRVVLPLTWTDRWRSTSRERLHRVRVEIHDAAMIVARDVQPLPTVVDNLIEERFDDDDQENVRAVAELVLATRCLAVRDSQYAAESSLLGGVVPDVELLARWWRTANALLDSASAALSESNASFDEPIQIMP